MEQNVLSWIWDSYLNRIWYILDSEMMEDNLLASLYEKEMWINLHF